MSERMHVSEVEELTGISRATLYMLMDTGQADLGAVIRSQERNTYIFFRPKVEKYVHGENEQTKELLSAVNTMSHLLTMAIHKIGGDSELRGLENAESVRT